MENDEVIAMTPLTPEQKEYFELKTAVTTMTRTVMTLMDEGKISPCLPRANRPHTKFWIENVLYAYLDRLQQEHKNGLFSYPDGNGNWITEKTTNNGQP